MAEPLPLALLGELAGSADGVEDRVAHAIDAHPHAAEALEPLGPLLVGADCELALRMRRGGRQLDAVGLMGPHACVLVAPTEPASRTGWWQVAAASGAPRLIATAVGLCPRGAHPHGDMVLPIPTAALEVAAGLGGFDDLVDELADAMAADGFPADAVRAALGDRCLFWTLAAVVGDGVEPAAVFSVVDASEQGLWLVGEGPADCSLLIAATPTSIWWALCAVFAAGDDSEDPT